MMPIAEESHRPWLPAIALVDDQPEDRAAYAHSLRAEGLQVEVIEGCFGNNPQKLVDLIKGIGLPTLCDYRLSVSGQFAYFSGAQVVSRLYQAGIPAVLTTMYEQQGQESLSRLRQHIPVVLEKEHVERKALEGAFRICQAELDGEYSVERRPHRVLVRVMDVKRSGRDLPDRAEVIIPAWHARTAVRVFLDDAPKALVKKMKREFRFFADVNIGARRSQDLYFTNLTPAPELRDDDGLA